MIIKNEPTAHGDPIVICNLDYFVPDMYNCTFLNLYYSCGFNIPKNNNPDCYIPKFLVLKHLVSFWLL